MTRSATSGPHNESFCYFFIRLIFRASRPGFYESRVWLRIENPTFCRVSAWWSLVKLGGVWWSLVESGGVWSLISLKGSGSTIPSPSPVQRATLDGNLHTMTSPRRSPDYLVGHHRPRCPCHTPCTHLHSCVFGPHMRSYHYRPHRGRGSHPTTGISSERYKPYHCRCFLEFKSINHNHPFQPTSLFINYKQPNNQTTKHPPSTTHNHQNAWLSRIPHSTIPDSGL